MQRVEVTVPDGIGPGDEFIIEYDGRSLSVQCPDGCSAGMPIELEIPAAAADTAPPVEVVVPDGCHAGDTFLVEFNGREFDVTVPDGCGPGVRA